MRIGLFPGSFNPFHEGHADIVREASKAFDCVHVLHCINPKKKDEFNFEEFKNNIVAKTGCVNRAIVNMDATSKMLCDYLKQSAYSMGLHVRPTAIIRGLRNGQDLDNDRAWQYWNQDLGIKLPFIYFISNREYIHYSSSAIREINSFRELV